MAAQQSPIMPSWKTQFGNSHRCQQQKQVKKLSRMSENLAFLAVFALLQFASHFSCLQTVNASAVLMNKARETTTNVSINAPDRCIFQEQNKSVEKEVGAVWFSSTDACLIYTCAAGVDEEGAYVSQTRVDCSEFYCDIDSELQARNGSCCGECVRTRCNYNGTVFNVGQTWRNDADCTLLECTTLASGIPMINAYQRRCPPLPPDCEPERVYTENCCQYCRSAVAVRIGDDAANEEIESGDIWTPEYYRQHPCVRDCKAGESPMTCHYTFVVEWYQTLSKACFDCPRNLTDCARPHCIPGNGLTRSITVVNRMMPGPSIEVCEHDTIVVDVRNNLLGESTTIHWHGLHQRETPYMDGVPHITQCPISPHASFRYTFKADNVGTHFWHSHTGMQRGDGVFGALIIRKPKSAEAHGALYDFDLSEHIMIVQDWVHMPGVTIFADHHHSRGDNKPHTLLVNGRGRYYNKIWEDAKQQMIGRTAAGARVTTTKAPKTSVPSEMSTTVPTPSEVDVLHPLSDVDRLRFRDNNGLSRLTRLAKQATKLSPVFSVFLEQQEQSDSTQEENVEINPTNSTTSHIRHKRANMEDIPLDQMPLQVFTVTRGFRYRFRIINAEFLNCPIVVSIDNHSLTAINSDGYDFEALEVGSIVTYAGERFDFVLNANQSIGNYWVRLKGLMDCSELFTSAFQVAILRYEGAPAEEPTAELMYAHKAEGIELNVMNRGPGHPDTKTVAELKALPNYDRVPGIDHDALKEEADFKFFVYYDFYAKNNPEFHLADYYGFDANLTKENRLYTPQLNHISLKFPSMALLPSRNEIDDSLFCNETSLEQQGIDCRKQFCKCHHVLQVPLNSIVEIILVDEGFTFYANHPFHLHGNAFRVVGLERLGENVTIEMVKQLDHYNLLKRNLVRPPVKDTVTVPDGGYTIIRFEAYNPGFWLFHCHIEFHAEIGMALVLKVGDNKEMEPVPHNFPTCKDYMPDMRDGEATSSPPNNGLGDITATTTATPTQTQKPGGSGGVTVARQKFTCVYTTLLLLGIAKYLSDLS